MEIFEIFKYLSIVIFSMLVLLSIFGRSRDGYFLATIIILGANFWIRTKLGEKPYVLEYFAALAFYVLAMIAAALISRRKKDKKTIPLDPRYPEEG